MIFSFQYAFGPLIFNMMHVNKIQVDGHSHSIFKAAFYSPKWVDEVPQKKWKKRKQVALKSLIQKVLIYNQKVQVMRATMRADNLLYGGEDEAAIKGRSYCRLPSNLKLTFPYDCIGLIRIYISRSQHYQGTGFLIDKDLVLTVCHNLFVGEDKTQARITFNLYKGQNDFDLYQVEDKKFNLRYLKQLQQLDHFTYDYALLKLKTPVLSRTKFLSITTNFGLGKQLSEINKSTLLVYGYPGSQQFAISGCQYSDAVKAIQNGFIYTLLPTESGHSGSPIIHKNNQSYQVIGIHQGFNRSKDQDGNYNRARLLIQDEYDVSGQIMEDINRWIIEFRSPKSLKSRPKIYLTSPKLFPNQRNRVVYSRVNKTQSNLSFWDRKGKDYSYFSFEKRVILLNTASNGGWKRLFTTNHIFFDYKQTVLIRNINLAKNGKICVGFVSKQFKQNDQSQCSQHFNQNFIGMMITSAGQTLKCEIRACRNLEENKFITIKSSEELFLNFRLCKQNNNSNKFCLSKQHPTRNESQISLMQLPLNKNSVDLDIDTNYYFYVSMCAPGTSVQIDL